MISGLAFLSAGEFCNQNNIYEDLVDLNVLRKFLSELLADYNMKPGIVPLDLVLFQDAIQHVTRIARVISQPRGNMLLVGVGNVLLSFYSHIHFLWM